MSVIDAGMSKIASLMNHWPNRAAFAAETGIPLTAVHKMAARNSIASKYQLRVVKAAQARGLAWCNADWMLSVHAADPCGDVVINGSLACPVHMGTGMAGVK